MKKIILSFFISVLFFVPYLAFAGTSYYCDCSVSGGTSGDGSWGNPFESIADINDASFSTGDDLYFKVGETCTATEKLSANWNGTSGDHVVIGAYYGEGQFGLNGGARPILDGQLSVPGNSSYQGLIHDGSGAEYIDVKDLHIYQSGYYGVNFVYAGNITYDNLKIEDSYNGGAFIILGSGGSGATVTNCILTGIGQVNNPVKQNNFGALVVSGYTNSGGTPATDVTISGNVLYNNYSSEVLSPWGGIDGGLIEKNVIYDNYNANVYLYLNAHKNATVRYNLIYATDADFRTDAISINNESGVNDCDTGGNEIYGNLIANMRRGIEFGISKESCQSSNDDNLVYNNTLIDNEWNIYVWESGENGSGNEFKNNISWTQSRGDHVNNCSPGGWTFDYNVWDDDPGTGNCDAANDPANGSPQLLKTSGWTSLTAGAVDGTEFSVVSPDSPAIDGGVVISGYNDRISASDFTASPPTVTTTEDGTNPDIGAWYYNSGESDPPTPNPATMASAVATSSQVTLTADTPSDVSTPIETSFDYDPDSDDCGSDADIGTGGSDSGWQSGDYDFVDNGLQPNQVYCWKVQHKDALGNTGTASSLTKLYTYSNTPGAPTLGNQGAATFDITANNENSNPASNPTTDFACQVTYSAPNDADWQNKWIQSDGSAGASEDWQADSVWDTGITLSGLNNNTTYGVSCKARNEDLAETALSTEAQVSTGVPPDSGVFNIMFTDITLEDL